MGYIARQRNNTPDSYKRRANKGEEAKMPMKVQRISDGKMCKILNDDYKKRRHTAFQHGAFEAPISAIYTFETEEWNRGMEQTARIREETRKGER